MQNGEKRQFSCLWCYVPLWCVLCRMACEENEGKHEACQRWQLSSSSSSPPWRALTRPQFSAHLWCSERSRDELADPPFHGPVGTKRTGNDWRTPDCSPGRISRESRSGWVRNREGSIIIYASEQSPVVTRQHKSAKCIKAAYYNNDRC